MAYIIGFHLCTADTPLIPRVTIRTCINGEWNTWPGFMFPEIYEFDIFKIRVQGKLVPPSVAFLLSIRCDSEDVVLWAYLTKFLFLLFLLHNYFCFIRI